ncbi:MAG: hypothetical protein ACRC2H_00220, partial [Silanimonas sp.]
MPEAATSTGRIREKLGDTAADAFGALQSVNPAAPVERGLVRAREVGAGLLGGAARLGNEAAAFSDAGASANRITGSETLADLGSAAGTGIRALSTRAQLIGDFVGGDIEAQRAEENARRRAAGRETREQESAGKLTSRAASALSGGIEDVRRSLSSDEQLANEAELSRAAQGGIGSTAEFLVDSPIDALSVVGPQAAGWLVPGLAAGRIGKAAGLTDELATAANVQSVGALSAETGARGVAEQIMEAPAEQLAGNPEYAALLAEGYSDEQARLTLARRGYDATLGAGLALNAGTGAAAQRLGLTPVEEILTTGGRRVGAGRLGAALGGALKEAPAEGLQGAGEQLAQNLGEAEAGERGRGELFDGIGSAALLEAAAGGVLGGAVGAVSPQRVADEVMSRPTEADPLAQAQRDVSAVYAAALAGVPDPAAPAPRQAPPVSEPVTAPPATDRAGQGEADVDAAIADLQAGNIQLPPAPAADPLEAQLQAAGVAPIITPGSSPDDRLAAAQFAQQQASPVSPSSSAPLGEKPQHDGAVTAGPSVPSVRVRTPKPDPAGRGAALPPLAPAGPVRPPLAPAPTDVEAAVSAAPDRIGFRDNDVVARAKLERTFLEFGIEPELARTMAQAERIPTGAIRDSVTGGFDGRADGVKADTIQRAIDHVEQSNEDAFFVSADISNLGGLNKFHNDVADEANRDFRGLTDIMLDELRGTGGDVVPMRTGGDEIGYVVVNASQEAVNAAIGRAKGRALQYARARGFDQIPHSKQGRADVGVTFHAGAAAIEPGMSVEEIARRADLGVNASKNAASPQGDQGNERREATGSIG